MFIREWHVSECGRRLQCELGFKIHLAKLNAKEKQHSGSAGKMRVEAEVVNAS